MSIEIAAWVGLGIAAIVVGVVLWRRRSTSATSGPSMEVESLREQLESLGVDTTSSRIPALEVLAPHLQPDETIVSAVRAKSGSKRALLVLLDDRIVAAIATIGEYGAEGRTMPLESIDSFEQAYDIGGEYRIEIGGDSLTYTHVPRSRVSEFADAVKERL